MTTTLEVLQQRLASLEVEVAELRKHHPFNGHSQKPKGPGAEEVPDSDFIPGAEYDFIVVVPPIEVSTLRGVIVSIEEGPRGLGLSQAEWDSLPLEEGDA